MNVHLTQELEQMVQDKVKTGLYNSASEVVREALRLMDERDKLKAMQKEKLNEMIEAGLKSIKEGRVVDGEAFFAQMEAELDEEVRVENEKTVQKQVKFK